MSLKDIALLDSGRYDLVRSLETILDDGVLKVGNEVWAVFDAKDMSYLLLVEEEQLVP